MKRLIPILFALLAFPAMASRHPDRMKRADINANLSFNRGDASDRSIYNHSPSLEGSAVVTAGTRYLTTTGAVADQATIPDSDSLSFTDGSGNDRPFSVSCWVYFTALPSAGNRAGVLRKGSKQATTTWEWDCWAQILDTTTGPAISLRHSNSAATISRSAPPLSAATWYHLAFLYDGSETVGGLKIYQNGVRVDNASGTSGTYTGMSNTATTLNVGSQSFGGTNTGLNGRTDDVRVYSRELTANEVMAIYSEGHP